MGLNATFISMAIGAGMTSAIINPLHVEVMTSVRAADVIMATDKECGNWLRACRAAAAAGGEGRERRSTRRQS
jgi:5-methyltetrahydrofolate--homocysteine methyltransferase